MAPPPNHGGKSMGSADLLYRLLTLMELVKNNASASAGPAAASSSAAGLMGPRSHRPSPTDYFKIAQQFKKWNNKAIAQDFLRPATAFLATTDYSEEDKCRTPGPDHVRY